MVHNFNQGKDIHPVERSFYILNKNLALKKELCDEAGAHSGES